MEDSTREDSREAQNPEPATPAQDSPGGGGKAHALGGRFEDPPGGKPHGLSGAGSAPGEAGKVLPHALGAPALYGPTTKPHPLSAPAPTADASEGPAEPPGRSGEAE